MKSQETKLVKSDEAATEPKLRHQPPSGRFSKSLAAVWRRKTTVIAVFAAAAIRGASHSALRLSHESSALIKFRCWPRSRSAAFRSSMISSRNFCGGNSVPTCWPEFPSSPRFCWENTLPAPSWS